MRTSTQQSIKLGEHFNRREDSIEEKILFGKKSLKYNNGK